MQCQLVHVARPAGCRYVYMYMYMNSKKACTSVNAWFKVAVKSSRARAQNSEILTSTC